jgi:hypothetical protein
MSIRRLALIPAIVLVLVGLLWILQGVGVLQGSVMTGDTRWEAIGFVVAVAGLAVGWFALGGRKRRRTQI